MTYPIALCTVHPVALDSYPDGSMLALAFGDTVDAVKKLDSTVTDCACILIAVPVEHARSACEHLQATIANGFDEIPSKP